MQFFELFFLVLKFLFKKLQNFMFFLNLFLYSSFFFSALIYLFVYSDKSIIFFAMFIHRLQFFLQFFFEKVINEETFKLWLCFVQNIFFFLILLIFILTLFWSCIFSFTFFLLKKNLTNTDKMAKKKKKKVKEKAIFELCFICTQFFLLVFIN